MTRTRRTYGVGVVGVDPAPPAVGLDQGGLHAGPRRAGGRAASSTARRIRSADRRATNCSNADSSAALIRCLPPSLSRRGETPGTNAPVTSIETRRVTRRRWLFHVGHEAALDRRTGDGRRTPWRSTRPELAQVLRGAGGHRRTARSSRLLARPRSTWTSDARRARRDRPGQGHQLRTKLAAGGVGGNLCGLSRGSAPGRTAAPRPATRNSVTTSGLGPRRPGSAACAPAGRAGEPPVGIGSCRPCSNTRSTRSA